MFVANAGLRRPSSSLVVFGNGRTHTGEVDGSGGSRLANYCLRASTSWKRCKPRQNQPYGSKWRHILRDILVSEWVADGGGGWGETLFLPCAPQSQSSSDSLKDSLYSGQGKECRPGSNIVLKLWGHFSGRTLWRWIPVKSCLPSWIPKGGDAGGNIWRYIRRYMEAKDILSVATIEMWIVQRL